MPYISESGADMGGLHLQTLGDARSLQRHQILTAFGRVLRKARIQRGLSIEALARQASVDRSFVGEIERGTHQPTLTSLRKLADGLGVEASLLLARMEVVLREQMTKESKGT